LVTDPCRIAKSGIINVRLTEVDKWSIFSLMDLGTESKDGADAIETPETPTIPSSLSLNGEQAANFLGAYECKPGDEVTATVKLKVKGLSDDTLGKNVSFDVVSVEDVQKGGAPAEGSEEDVLGYKRPVVEKETPSLSAKDLQE
jgi:hypothetical protein